jgi:L-ascorbate metabolism protein UlaG (beta-lactamase superfamily)
MTPEMVAEAAKVIRPRILYPYHYGNTDTDQLLELMRNERDIEVRVRSF